jgi:hypothetical protein
MKQLLTMLLITATLFASAQDKQPVKQQCKGITVKGLQCKNKAKEGTDYCYLHDPGTLRCGATTSKGKPCRNIVHAAGQKCWRHQ